MDQIIDFFKNLFSSADWPPRWHCGRWTEFHGWLYIISDLLIWSAYFSIPVIIIRYISRRQDIRFVRLYFLFAAFILACGATHFLDAVAFWIPAYRLNALVRLITGILSWLTVFYLVKNLPIIFSLKPQKALELEIIQRKKAEEKFRALLDAAPDATVLVNEDGIIQLINQQTINLFGYSREDLINQPVEILMPDDLRGRHIQHRRNFFKAAKARTMGAGIELNAVKKDGMRFPVEISLSPISTEEGTLVSAAVRDISHRKSLEDELKKTNAEMEAFTYSVSHDLRAPLRGIMGFTTILEEDYTSKLDDEAKRITSVIKSNTLRMGHLIDDLLAFSRMGKQEIVKNQINIELMVAEIIEEMALPQNKQSNPEWDIRQLPSVNADLNTIRQVWINLISNAIKYAGNKEHPRIEIGSFLQDGYIVFYVKDNGVGFDDQYKDKLFKVFQRLHSAEEFEGTGIGLALVEKIVYRHGGKVWAEGKVDDGACFYFSLPVEN